MKNVAGISLIVVSLILGGCIIAPGTGDRDGPSRMRPTAGQELLDLDRARDAGVISEGEYQQARERILNNIN